MNAKNRLILIKLLAVEFILMNLVLAIFLIVREPTFSFTNAEFISKWMRLTVIYNITWLLIILYIRDNEFYFNPYHNHAKSILISTYFFVGFEITMVIGLKIDFFNRSTFILPIFLFAVLNLLLHRYFLRYLKRKNSNLIYRTLLLSACNENIAFKSIHDGLTLFGYNVIGCLCAKGKADWPMGQLQINGTLDQLESTLKNNAIDEIFIAMPGLSPEKIQESITIADNHGIRVKLIPENPLLMARNYKTFTMGNQAVFNLRQSPLDSFNRTIYKRLFDFFFALFVMLLLFPVFILISILIALESGFPILYTPYRKGEAGKLFRCYKFRTMRNCDNPLNGTKSTVRNDPRITRVGKFLRKWDLDELPQFYNVLRGEMSVVGPRPHRSRLQEDFRKSVNNYMVRSYIKPGITGWAQINGWRGPTVTKKQKSERVKHDVWYIENWSAFLDLKIIYRTLFGNDRNNAF